MSEYFGKIDALPITAEGNFIKNSDKRIVFGPDGRFWDDHVMRCFTLHPGAAANTHSHAWSHYIVCLSGSGSVKVGDEKGDMTPGTWIFTPANIPHNFKNLSETEDLVFLCVVPTEGDVPPSNMAGMC